MRSRDAYVKNKPGFIRGGRCNVVSALGSAVCGFGTSDGTRRTTHCRSYPRKLSRGRIVSRSICTQPHCSWRARSVYLHNERIYVRIYVAWSAAVREVPRGKPEGTRGTSEALTDFMNDFSRYCALVLEYLFSFKWTYTCFHRDNFAMIFTRQWVSRELLRILLLIIFSI